MATLTSGTGLGEETPARPLREKTITASPQAVDWAPSATPTLSSCLGASSSWAETPVQYRNLGAFRDFTKLHVGIHSTVWSAVCQRTGQTVVVKGYNRDSLKPRQFNNVRREISLLRFFRDIGCKGVVGLLSVFEDEDGKMIYLVFEACMGGDLYAHRMRNRGTLHEEYVVTKVVFPLLSVLQQLHQLHIIHRDIKPENIFLTETGEIALGDFGLAGHKFNDQMTERVGTLDYMAPEVLSTPPHDDQTHEPGQAADAAQTYDEKVDIWASGVLVYELLVGRPPFEVDDPQETARLILNSQPSNYPVHISHYARDFVAQALTKSADARPSAEQLLQHAWLRHYFGGKIPDSSGATGGGVTAGLLKSWLVASWADLSKASPGALRPDSVAPIRLVLSPEDALKSSAGCDRKSAAGSSGGGANTAASPSGQQVEHYPDGGLAHMSLESGEVESGDPAMNRLAASQYPSRDSSTGSMDQAVPADRVYVRNDSDASASSGISITSFASLQNMPHSATVAEVSEQDELGLVQRSASICPANISRMPVAHPSAGTLLRPAWQNGTTLAGVGSKKTPGKSRFAA